MTAALILAGVGLAAAAGYVVECLVWPWTTCRRCRATPGRHKAWWGVQAWRLCRRCGGTGRVLRIGRRAYNLYRKLRSS